MNYIHLLKEQNDEVKERYDLAMERISQIVNEQTVGPLYQDYFHKVSNFILQIEELLQSVEKNETETLSLEELKKQNDSLYCDISDENYETSYSNPTYAVKALGEDYGRLLCFLYTEIRGMIVFAYEYRLFNLTIGMEVFIEIYNLFELEEHPPKQRIKEALYYYISDYSELTIDFRIRESLDPNLSFASDIIMNSDLLDLRYLYYYGEYITDIEHDVATFLNSLTEQEIDDIAATFVNGYRRGFQQNNIDLSKKSLLDIRFTIGFERIVRAVILKLRKLNLQPVIYRNAVESINRQRQRRGYTSLSYNKQFDYDHRFDNALYLDKAFCERILTVKRLAFEKYNELASQMAGPALIQTFGEKQFIPVAKSENYKLNEKQQKLFVHLNMESSLLQNEYIKSEETSFVIIAFPTPEIGKDFKDIFAETMKVNTLDNKIYEDIQQIIIDELDKGDYVHIKGQNGNKTDLKVSLQMLHNPEKETRFENCTADVNIPVGEVFTSPKLEGTSGLLHVKKVYLNNLEYIDLELYFEDGMITKYSCKNFDDENENQRFIKENLLYNHDTLPMGEFAIGTNTTAYRMAQRYNIMEKLPILIAEKTGPHFAVGDTCYSMSEDNRIWNPNGKEITAKDNSRSAMRKEQPDKAYFGCHTDITIPYHELGGISVMKLGSGGVKIIESGRFVLSGTEVLNLPLDESSF